MSTSTSLHLSETGMVKLFVPRENATRGWLKITDRSSVAANDVAVFPPDDPQLAIEFLRSLASNANELALMIDAERTTP